jgi:hypothetical protein
MLSNFDLERRAGKNNIKLDGIIFKDDIFSIKKQKNLNIILNLDNKGGNGTHWVLLIKRDKNLLYFNSFGTPPPDILITYTKQLKNNCKLFSNSYICQDLSSTVCGYYCLCLIHYIDNNKGSLIDKADEFINLFESNTKLNKKILMNYYKTQMKK